MTDDHQQYRDWSAAYALGALEPDERRAFEDHLARCDDCAEAVQSFAPLPGVLSQADPLDLEPSSSSDLFASIERSVRADIVAVVASRRRWRLVALAAMAAAIVVAVVAPWPEDGPSRAEPDEITFTAADSASVATEARGWGTAVSIELHGLPQRALYHLWTVSDDGTWVTAATWGPTPSGSAILTGATSTARDELQRIVVTGEETDDILVEAAPREQP